MALLEQRVAVNEDSIGVALNYFKDNIDLPPSKALASSGAPHFGGGNSYSKAAASVYQ